MKVKMRAHAKTQLIKGPAGQLEVRLQAANLPAGKQKKLLVLCHPHSLYGGSMNNKVITTIENAACKQGFSTLCLNFRGVGKSEGEYDAGNGELEDLKAAVSWGLAMVEADTLHLAGFSFGSFVALQALTSFDVASLLTVAPPVGLYDFSKIQLPEYALAGEFQWVMIQGGQDEVVCAKESLSWVRAQNLKPDIFWREQASHFFHGELIWLRRVLGVIYG